VSAPKNGLAGSLWILFMDPACSVPLAGPGLNAACVVKPAPGGFHEIVGADHGLGFNSRLGQTLSWFEDPTGSLPNRLAAGAHFVNVGFLFELAADGSVSDATALIPGQDGIPGLGANPAFGVSFEGLQISHDGIPYLAMGLLGGSAPGRAASLGHSTPATTSRAASRSPTSTATASRT
jgi:hypothetical protein